MATCPDHGIYNPKMVDVSTKKLTGQRFGSSVPPMKDLKNDPSNDAMRAIRSMKFTPQGSWGKNAESAIRQKVK